MTARLPERIYEYNGLLTDASRWDRFTARPGDIFVCTPPKCGTTWMQAICALLVFQTPVLEINPAAISPWLDSVFVPIEDDIAMLESQSHRRVIKTHTPLDGIPYHEECTYVAVYRDPRDAYFSMLNHIENMKLELPRGVLADDPVERFRTWVEIESEPGAGVEFALLALMHHFESFRAFEHLPNIELHHYADLKADLALEMGRVAAGLGIEVEPELLLELAETARFENMKKHAESFAPGVHHDAWHDTQRFFHRGESGQWRDVLSDEELALFQKALDRQLDADSAHWLLHGGHRA